MSVVCQRRRVARALSIVLFAIASASPAIASGPEPSPEVVRPNDNRHAAGTRDRETLTVALRAARGAGSRKVPRVRRWTIEAFGEVGKALTVPAPLIRVDEGTQIACRFATISTPPWSSTASARATARRAPRSRCRRARDTRGALRQRPLPAPITTGPRRSARRCPFRELAGAFIVDPATGAAEPDRDPRDHRMDQPDAAAARRDHDRRRSQRSLRRAEAARHVRDQRPVVAGDRALRPTRWAIVCAGA